MALGLGLGTTDQPVPFQDSISVLVALPLVLPTAVHAVAETHDTPSSSLYACAGLGLGTTDQIRVCALAGSEMPAAAVTLKAATPIPASAARVLARLIILIRGLLPLALIPLLRRPSRLER
jgi:hypothetical protein